MSPPPAEGEPYAFFGCEVRKGKPLVLPTYPGRSLILKQAALTDAAQGSTTVLIKTASTTVPMVLCSLRQGYEQSSMAAILGSDDGATLELGGAAASVHIVGARHAPGAPSPHPTAALESAFLIFFH